MTTMLSRLSALTLSLAVVAFALTGCDSTTTGEETITLNPNSGLDPVVHSMSYDESTCTSGQTGIVEVTTPAETSLESKLRELDYSLSDVTAAEITKVTMTRQSSQANVMRKVFPYLSRAEVYLGGSGGTLVASRSPVPSPDFSEPVEMDLSDGSDSVASFVTNGNTNATLVLDLDDCSNIGGSSGTSDKLDLEVTYSLTVPLN